MEEIPLVFPSHADAPRRYLVDYKGSRMLVPRDVTANNNINYSNNNSMNNIDNEWSGLPVDECLPGAASVSVVRRRRLDDGNPDQELLVTTAALLEAPHVISVALSWKQDGLASPSMVELELPMSIDTETDDPRSLQVVAIKALGDDDNDHGNTWQQRWGFKLVLVFRRGTVVTLRLDEQMIPITTDLQVLHPRDYLKGSPALLEQIVAPGSSSELEPNRVGFLSPARLVLALAPVLLTVDLSSGQGAIWSESQTKEDMQTRAGYGSMFVTGFLTTMLLGKVDEQSVLDMPPTAALCVATTPDQGTLLDMDSYATKTTLVFTLHSDGSMRKWKLVNNDAKGVALLPLEVATLDAATKELVPNTDWSDSRNAINLSARVYNRQFFALAVFIQTDDTGGGMVTMGEGDVEEEGTTNSGGCRLWTINGADDGKEKPKCECQSLQVPPHAESLVDMSWVPTEQRSALSAVFEVGSTISGSGTRGIDSDSGTTLQWVTYPHSNFSIVSKQPQLIHTTTLDQIANHEKDRIRSLSFGTTVLIESEDDDENTYAKVKTGPNNKIDKTLHELDTCYMQYLFRPLFPRGNGTVMPPTSVYVRRALSKLVRGAHKEHGMSVELETVRTIYEWRNRDKRKAAARTVSPIKQTRLSVEAATPNLAGVSVYDSFVEFDGANDNEGPTLAAAAAADGIDTCSMDDIFDDEEELAMMLEKEVEAHESRWRRLLYQIWLEEQVHRTPLCISWLDRLPMHLVVRGGVTTIVTPGGRSDSTTDEPSWQATLDKAAENMIAFIESHPVKSKALYGIEERVARLVAQGQLAVSPNIAITEDLTSLGRWARSKSNISDGRTLKDIIGQQSAEGLVAWAQSKPSVMGVLDTPGFLQSRTGSSIGLRVANNQCRHSACSLTLRAIDFSRRAALSRCLLLLELAGGSHATQASLRAYLRCLSVLWTSGQRIPMSETAFRPTVARRIRFEDSQETESPPHKRSSSGDQSSSILAPIDPKMTTVLDAVIIGISQSLHAAANVSSSPASAILTLTGTFVDLMYPSAGDTESNSFANPLIPELNVLPKPRDSNKGFDHPKLALRILAPYVAIVIEEDRPESVMARKESLSACLLFAALSSAPSLSLSQRSLMRQTACELLIPESSDYSNLDVDKHMIRTGLDWLNSAREETSTDDILAVTKDQTIRWLETILSQKTTSIEVQRLCGLPTSRRLFDPLSAKSTRSADQMNNEERLGIQKVAEAMLRLSRIQHRLSILETPISSATGSDEDAYSSDSLLELISDAIREVETTFPDDFVEQMPEYTSLWSKKFQRAVHARRWNRAFDACARNPVGDYRDTNYRMLVQKMVDGGDLSHLVNMCIEVGNLGVSEGAVVTESIDLYEVSCDVLLKCSGSRDVYDIRATASNQTPVPDYEGALYALHASHENWRRAAQSLDLKYINAKKSLNKPMTGFGTLSLSSKGLREKLIVEDLVLAASGSARVIQLVKDPADHFLISGEFGPYSSLPTGDGNDTLGEVNSLKRGRFGGETPTRVSCREESGDTDRLSNFKTSTHLEGRAVRCIGLRKLFLDRQVDPVFAKSGFSNEKIAMETINALYSNGYFHYGSLLAEAKCKEFELLTGSRGVGGEDMFGQSLADLLTNSLVPMTVASDAALYAARPTSQQLHVAVDTAGSIQTNQSFVVTERTYNLVSLQGVKTRAAVCLLIQKLTMAYSSSAFPLAEYVAESFLDLTDFAQLPVWLERFLMGADNAESTVGAGTAVFAARSKPGSTRYMGNPQALLSMYISRGMLIEACNVVTLVLQGFGNESPQSLATKAASRLPEKGDIDYTPYMSIDLLWNLIELATGQRSTLAADDRARVLQSRGKMERALKKHFEDSRTSELGLRSARASARIISG